MGMNSPVAYIQMSKISIVKKCHMNNVLSGPQNYMPVLSMMCKSEFRIICFVNFRV